MLDTMGTDPWMHAEMGGLGVAMPDGWWWMDAGMDDDVAGYFTPITIPIPNPDAPGTLPPAVAAILHLGGSLGAIVPPPPRPGPRPSPAGFAG